MGDVLLRRWVYATLSAQVLLLSAHEDGDERVVKLVIQNKGFDYKPGQYAELKIPEISTTEWHPFTIASSPTGDGSVTFYIKDAGRWTSCLYQLAKTGRAPKKVGLRGPFGAPAQNYFSYDHIIVIGSGIGVTPLLSVWKYLVQNASSHVLDDSASSASLSKPHQRKKNVESDDSREEWLLNSVNMSAVDVVLLDKTHSSFRGHVAYYASILESMTVNICVSTRCYFPELVARLVCLIC